MAENYNINCENSQLNQSSDSSFKIYDPGNTSENELAKSLNNELMNIASAPVTIYKLLETKVDELYGEVSDAKYSDPFTDIAGYFTHQPLMWLLQAWGIDSDIDFVIFFPRDEIIKKIGRLVQPGDLIYNHEKRLFEVLEIHDDSSFKFNWINQYCLCKRKLGDTSALLGDYEKTTNEGHTDADAKEKLYYDPLYNEKRAAQ